MNEKVLTNPIVLIIRKYLLQHKKLVWGVLGFLTIFAICAVILMYYRINVQQENSANFYKLIFHDLENINDANKTQQALNDYLNQGNNIFNNKSFFNSYVNQHSAKNALESDNTSDLSTILAHAESNTNDDLLNDLIKFNKANYYFKIKDYDSALSEISTVKSSILGDLQLYTFAKINLANNEKLKAEANIEELLNKYPNSPLRLLTENFQFLIN